MRSATDDEDDSAVPTLTALGTVALIAGVAAIAAVSESVSLAIETSKFPPSSVAPAPVCRSCGVVQSVSELAPRPVKHEVSTVAGGGPEGVAVLLGALGGAMRIAPVGTLHEVLVRMDDGSLRAVQLRGKPEWRQGDRVRVFKGELVAAPEAPRGEVSRIGCSAGANERVLVAWKDGRHYCIRYDVLSGAPRGVEPTVFALRAAVEVN